MATLFTETNNSSGRSVIAYAFLAQATRGEGDLLSGLAPIFKPIAKIHAGERFDTGEFSELVNDLYGLKIHPWAVEDLAPRLERSGLLVKIPQSNEAHEYVYAEVAEEYDAVTDKDIEKVISRFIEFATPILKQNKLPVDEKALEEGFLSQLVDMDFVSILLKPDRTKEDRRGSNTLSIKKTKEQSEWEENVSVHSKLNVLCASFIVEVYHTDEVLYDLIMQIATGAILSEVVLNLQDPGQTVSLKGLTVILDAPFLMSSLNLASEEAYTFAREICDQLRDKEARLVTFSHCIDELKDNLKAVISATRDGIGYGETARRLKNPAFAAYAKSLLENTDTILKQENIGQINIPKSEDFFQYFNGGDQEDLQHSLGFYQNKLAQERDAESIAATIRLRRGKQVKMGRLPTAGYLFVTENTWVVLRAEKFLKRHDLFRDGEVPPAVSERYLAGLLWVLYGGKGKELTKHLLLANCAAALEPRSDVISQMHRFLSQVDDKQAEFFHTLMTEERAGQYVMQFTLGDSAFLDQNNAPVVLEQIKKSLIEKHEAEKKLEIESIREKHQKEIEQQERLNEQLREKLLEAEATSMQTRNEVNEINKMVEQLKSSVLSESKARLEEKKRYIERSLRAAIRYEKRAYIIAGVLFSTVVNFIAWLVYQNAENQLLYNTSIAIVWFLMVISFWKMPDIIFSDWVHQLRQGKFNKYLEQAGITIVEGEFSIDWKTQRVSMEEKEAETK